jgi:hypothetical protein
MLLLVGSKLSFHSTPEIPSYILPLLSFLESLIWDQNPQWKRLCGDQFTYCVSENRLLWMT